MTGEDATDRREFLRNTALAALVGAAPQAASQHVHEHAAQAKAKADGAPYKPKALTAAEYRTVGILAEMIIPAEDGQPGGVAAGAPEYIDLLCSGAEEMAQSWQQGLAWLEAHSRREHGAGFALLSDAQRRTVIDRIAFRKNASPEANPGIRFFTLARQMVVDAWVTSPEGTKILGYQGNAGMQKFQVPVESLNYALARSPFKEG
jgi:hypothetical protein